MSQTPVPPTPGQVLLALRTKLRIKSQRLFGMRYLDWSEDIVRDKETGRTKITDADVNLLMNTWIETIDVAYWRQQFKVAMDYQSQQESERILVAPPRQRNQRKSDLVESTTDQIQFCLRRHQIVAVVHDEYAVDLDNQIREALISLNQNRRNRGYDGYSASTSYQLIKPPEFGETGMVLHFTPYNFAFHALLYDDEAPPSIKEYIKQKVNKIADIIPENLQSNHPTINANKSGPLGVQIALVTSDGKILLRKRGNNVLGNRGEWEMSCSGFCDRSDRIPGGELNIEATVVRRVESKLGIMRSNPKEIIFTGIYVNINPPGELMLVYCPIEATANELINLITDAQPEILGVFDTTKRARESAVWDGKNLVVDFSAMAVVQAIQAITAKEDERVVISPGTITCLRRSFEVTGKSTEGLETLSS